jgi:hypothetical protein
MRKIAILTIMVLVGLSCSKKKTEDPKPAGGTKKADTPQVAKKDEPIYARLSFENGTPYPDWTLKAVFVSNDSSTGIKTDKYRVTLETTTAPKKFVVDTLCNLWWESGTPKSNYLKFKTSCYDTKTPCTVGWSVALPERDMWIRY